jgi:OOP family OmpA-OmpF porin
MGFTMKKMYLFLTVFLIASTAFAQVAKNSWGFDFGLSYPRAVSQNNGIVGNINYGAYIGVTRNFSESVGMRAKLKYNNLQFKQTNTSPWTETNTTVLGGDIDFLYRFVPCEKASPYLLVGLGGIYADNSANNGSASESLIDYEFNFGLGVNVKLSDSWDFASEFVYHTAPASNLDGYWGTSGNGMLGGNEDTYMSMNFGLIYYFSKGEPSKLCQIYEGIKAPEIDYERIDNIVKKNTANVGVNKAEVKDAVSEAIAEFHAKEEHAHKVILSGVNFEFNSAKLTPESYPILFHAAMTLLENPDLKVDVIGYTDNIGSAKYNKALSLKRANAVKHYLIARGVDASRINTIGMGEENPIASNKTAEGRALNRRIEFKVHK